MHLEPIISERGFKRLPSIPSSYGGEITVYESSNAMGPHVWVRFVTPVNLNDPQGVTEEGIAHLPLDEAAKLRDQLDYLITHHYQLEGD